MFTGFNVTEPATLFEVTSMVEGVYFRVIPSGNVKLCGAAGKVYALLHRCLPSSNDARRRDGAIYCSLLAKSKLVVVDIKQATGEVHSALDGHWGNHIDTCRVVYSEVTKRAITITINCFALQRCSATDKEAR